MEIGDIAPKLAHKLLTKRLKTTLR